LSSVRPLPLPLLESDPAPDALKQQVVERLARHRQKRGLEDPVSKSLPVEPRNPVAAAVAARFSQTVTYQDYLAAEAEAAIREAEQARNQAEAAAEVARRNAEAVAATQRELMEELEEWNSRIASANASNPHLREVAVPREPHPGPQFVPQVELQAPAVEQILVSPAAATVESATPGSGIITSALVTPPEQSAPRIPRPEMPAVSAEPSVGLPTNLLEFPRQLIAARKARPRLAEGPLRDTATDPAQLRIFEVEVDQISTQPSTESTLPEWSSIRLDARTEAYAPASLNAQLSFILPPQTAPMSLRFMASVVDASCVMAAFLGFVAVAAYVSPVVPTGQVALISASGVFFALHIAYRLLFFSFSGATPGMRYAHIGLCTFSDDNPTRSAMRRRIFATLLAACPLGMGFLWAALDDDSLGWHDRISRMYQRAY
jgi:uncharacterized RDD family membrane protein YckC